MNLAPYRGQVQNCELDRLQYGIDRSKIADFFLVRGKLYQSRQI